MKLSLKTKRQLSVQKFIFIFLFISTIAMAAWLGNRYNTQLDLTLDKRHSLSNTSIKLLQLLDKPLTIHAYTQSETNQQAIREIIARYQKYKTNFKLKIFNPDIDISQAQQDNIVFKKQFAFVLFYDHKTAPIYSLSETAISNALLRLSRNNQQVVFLTGHGERAINTLVSNSFSVLNTKLTQIGFNLKSVNLINQTLPLSTKLLVIASPTDPYFSGEKEKIIQYIKNGGNVLLLADPTGSAKINQNFNDLLTLFSLKLQQGIIVDSDKTVRKMLNISHPAAIPVTDYYPHTITQSLPYNSLFFLARGIEPLKKLSPIIGFDWIIESLFSSSKKSWSDADAFDENNHLNKNIVFSSSQGDVAGPVTFAVALHRQLKLNKNQQKSQRIVVIGDSDFMSNKYIGSGSNKSLTLNIFNWLTGDDNYISIETKNKKGIKLQLSNLQVMFIGFGFFLIIPLAFLSIGFIIQYKRKKH